MHYLHYNNGANAELRANYSFEHASCQDARLEKQMKFGEKLIYARKQLGLSRDALSEMTGISKRAIAYY